MISSTEWVSSVTPTWVLISWCWNPWYDQSSAVAPSGRYVRTVSMLGTASAPYSVTNAPPGISAATFQWPQYQPG